jgi:Trk K+ transport system NAD-binding subunit
MFEFTHLGLVVFLVTGLYLLTVGYWLAPSHVTPRSKLETTQQEEFLTEVIVGDESPFVGSTIREALEEVDFEANVTQLIRAGAYHREPRLSMTIREGDTFTIRLTEDALRTLHEVEGIEFVPEVTPPGGLDALGPGQTLIEIVVTAGSDLVGETVESSRFQDQYQTAVLAIRRGGETA